MSHEIMSIDLDVTNLVFEFGPTYVYINRIVIRRREEKKRKTLKTE